MSDQQVVNGSPDFVRGQTIDQEGVARGEADARAALEGGFASAPPVYALGTMVVQQGIDNFKQSHRDFQEQEKLPDACDALVARIEAETRRDVPMEVPSLLFTNEGAIVVPGDQGSEVYPMTERAFESLAAQFTPGMGGYGRNLGVLEEDDLGRAKGMVLRAFNMNHWLPRAIRVDKRATKKQNKEWSQANFDRFNQGLPPLPKPAAATIKVPRKGMLRLRKRVGGEGEEVFAVVGPRYSKFDIDQIAVELKKVMSRDGFGDARCTVLYNGYKAQWDVLFHSNIQPEKAVAGEFFKAGIRITTADDGSGAIKIQTLLWRNLCLNFMIIDVAKVTTLSRRHVGEQLAAAVTQGIEDAQRRIGYFCKKWDESTVENVLERYGLEEPREVFERLVANKVVWVANYTPEEQVDRFMDCYNIEPGWGADKYINAITRAAHHHGWKNMDTAAELEQAAGSLLFTKVWNLDAPPATEEEALNW